MTTGRLQQCSHSAANTRLPDSSGHFKLPILSYRGLDRIAIVDILSIYNIYMYLSLSIYVSIILYTLM